MRTLLWLKLKKLKDDYKIMLVMMVLSIAFVAIFNMAGYSGSATRIGIERSSMGWDVEVEARLEGGSSYEIIWFEKGLGSTALDKTEIDVLYVVDVYSDEKIEVSKFKLREDMNAIAAEQAFEGKWRGLLSRDALVDKVSAVLSGMSGTSAEATYLKTVDYFDKQDRRGVDMMPVVSSLIETDSIWSGYDSSLHGLIGFTIMFAMYTVTFGVGDIITEKKNYTWQRALVSPIKKYEIMFGHLVSIFVLGFLQIMTVFIFGQFVLKIDWGVGNLVPVAILVGAFSFAITGMGLLLTGIVKSMSQLGATAPILITGSAMLGGCMWPLQIVNSKVMLMMANFTPQKWAIEGIENLTMYHLGTDTIATPLIMLLIMGTLFSIIGYVLVDRQQVT
ncbi:MULTISPECIES: ABC transporter permease [unclassified Fusibacter]|uniref:ABC transporter permease n=1 Tax=unclassified Fusibacter TaxID=2624464 RepID=UPI001013121C|nr:MULTISPECIES: ABC transporter permease [unclassified Fusibacter]MCK8059790.1 ABC transporter permease [Fusibacter sp. A2]NPE21591.1 ABC transporter permease [Fusibacter sp. A1]RXV61998.1 ABC transporter permease [Fusibacter sp. A1]